MFCVCMPVIHRSHLSGKFSQCTLTPPPPTPTPRLEWAMRAQIRSNTIVPPFLKRGVFGHVVDGHVFPVSNAVSMVH